MNCNLLFNKQCKNVGGSSDSIHCYFPKFDLIIIYSLRIFQPCPQTFLCIYTERLIQVWQRMAAYTNIKRSGGFINRKRKQTGSQNMQHLAQTVYADNTHMPRGYGSLLTSIMQVSGRAAQGRPPKQVGNAWREQGKQPGLGLGVG